jgi:putative protein-disulfide isomerase
MKNPDCDIDSGTCQPLAPGSGQNRVKEWRAGRELIYIGDPMCSWCWGIAPALKQLRDYYQQQQLPFRVLVGGLRPGGGDPWNREFRQFLARHWEEIGKLTGQPFSDGILNWASFNYDTEPACRSIAAARPLLDGTELDFFSAVQRKFYVDNDDPKLPGFYLSICDEFKLDFGEFLRRFNSDDVKRNTFDEFQLSRSWGVSGFPSVLLQVDGRITKVASGFSTFEKMRATVSSVLSQTS